MRKSKSTNNLANSIQESEYIRQRLNPSPNDVLYLHLYDLLLALEEFRSEKTISVLDYGCGGSPYRSLFPQANYCRADFLQAEGDRLDYVLDEYSHVDERDETFDLILSTQVLEHVTNPLGYLSESFRLLKPNGKLVCTTHGTFQDHGCPYDFQRWTADGLRRDAEKVGFEIEKVVKLTTGARAFFSILELSIGHLYFQRSTLLGVFVTFLRSFYSRFKPYINTELNRKRANESLVINDNNYPLYIGLMIVGRKP